MIVIVLFFAGLAGRLLFRKPWTVNARAEGKLIRRWKVVDFRASGRKRTEVAEALREGHRLPA